MAQRKKGKATTDTIQKKLAAVDKLFDELENDKSLPSFSEHFIQCLIFGIGRNVDLQALYPRQYEKVSVWLKQHNESLKRSK